MLNWNNLTSLPQEQRSSQTQGLYCIFISSLIHLLSQSFLSYSLSCCTSFLTHSVPCPLNFSSPMSLTYLFTHCRVYLLFYSLIHHVNGLTYPKAHVISSFDISQSYHSFTPLLTQSHINHLFIHTSRHAMADSPSVVLSQWLAVSFACVLHHSLIPHILSYPCAH